MMIISQLSVGYRCPNGFPASTKKLVKIEKWIQTFIIEKPHVILDGTTTSKKQFPSEYDRSFLQGAQRALRCCFISVPRNFFDFDTYSDQPVNKTNYNTPVVGHYNRNQ